MYYHVYFSSDAEQRVRDLMVEFDRIQKYREYGRLLTDYRLSVMCFYPFME